MLLPANFNATEPLVASRFFEAYDRRFNPGDDVAVAALGADPEREDGGLDHSTGLRLWLVGYLVYAKDYRPTPTETPQSEAERVVKLEELGGGWFLLTTPWGGEGEKVQGKEAAEARRQELVEKGDTKGVVVHENGGGWYSITAPWLDDAVKVQGKEAAAVEERMLIDQGPPDGWKPETEEEKAARIAAKSNSQDAQQQDAATDNGATDAETAAARARAAQEATDQSVVLTATGGGWYDVSAPWLDEPVRVRGKEAAEQRAAEIRRDGAPAVDQAQVGDGRTDDPSSSTDGGAIDTGVSGAEDGQSAAPVPAAGPIEGATGSENGQAKSDAAAVAAGEGATEAAPEGNQEA